MVDIETLGKAASAKIATLGAVTVDLLTSETLGEFYIRFDLYQPKRSISTDVTDWWIEQREINPLAHKEVFDATLDKVPLATGLSLFSEFLNAMYNGERAQIMGNGPEFDNVILNNAYEQLGMVAPWDFGCNQSLRTAVLFGRIFFGIDPKYQSEFLGVQHHALDDAKHEAKTLLMIAERFLRASKNPPDRI